MEFEAVIGLEIHAQLLTKTKIFCNCSAEFGRPPNENTCPVCLGQPGVLPVLNKKVVEYAMRMALATHCTIAPKSIFARKNYFYPDLPKGYQISQYESPLAIGGWVEIPLTPTLSPEGRGKGEGRKKIGITRIHMEEDAGKLLHEHPKTRDTTASWVDLNRAGVPLIEIVSEPDIRTPVEAAAYLKAVRDILVYLDICDGNMEEGSLRCDANISMRPVGQEKFGRKTELKNMNSFRNVEKALAYEIERQTAVLKDGGRIVQETLLWDADNGRTLSMRGKEDAHDYRYFPDPDLLPLMIEKGWIDDVKKGLPELPEVKKKRFVSEYGLPEYDAQVLTHSKALANFFEECAKLYPNPKVLSNWIMTDLLRGLKNDGKEIEECRITPKDFADLLKMADDGKVTRNTAKTVLAEMYKSGENPGAIIKEGGLAPVADEGELMKVAEKIVAANPKEAARFKAGEEKLISFFLGQAMKETKGKADPTSLREVMLRKLKL